MIAIEIKKEDRKYVFMMPLGCPLGEAYDVCHETLQEIIKMSHELADRAKREESNLKEEKKEDK